MAKCILQGCSAPFAPTAALSGNYRVSEKLTPLLEMPWPKVPGYSHLHWKTWVRISALERGQPVGGECQKAHKCVWHIGVLQQEMNIACIEITYCNGGGSFARVSWVQSISFPPKAQINANFTHLHFSCWHVSWYWSKFFCLCVHVSFNDVVPWLLPLFSLLWYFCWTPRWPALLFNLSTFFFFLFFFPCCRW